MVSFKEFLNKKTINENVLEDNKIFKTDIVLKSIFDWIKQRQQKHEETEIDGFNDDEVIEALKEINKIIEKNGGKVIELDEEDEEKRKDVIDKLKNLYKKVVDLKTEKKRHFAGDIGESKDLKNDFFKSLIDEKDSIAKLNGNKVKKIVSFFKENDNGDKKISKDEFFKAIEEIKKYYSSDLIIPATILWLMYLRQVIKDKKEEVNIFNKNSDSLNTNTAFNALKLENFFVKDGKQTTKNFNTLNLIFNSFDGYELDASILKNFKNPNVAERYLRQDMDGIKKNTIGNFAEKNNLKSNNDKNEKNLKDNSNDEFDDISIDDNELDDKTDNSSDDSENNSKKVDEVITKRKWFIYDVELPTAGNDKSLEKFINFMTSENEDGPVGKFNTIVKELNSYKEKYGKDYLNTDAKKTTQNESIINKYINREKVISEGFLFKSIESYEKELKEINTEYEKKLRKLNDRLSGETKYSRYNKLELEFKNTLIDWGSETSKLIINFKKAAEPELEKIKDKKYRDSFGKTPEQKGQESLNIQSIKKIFIDPKYLNDSIEIAKYMLVNVLKERTDPKEVINILNAKNFQKIPYVYSGTSNFVYALNAKDVIVEEKIIGDTKLKTYSFNKGKVKIYKNPANLLNQLGVSIDSLTPEVLLAIKKDMPSEISQRASEYKTSSENLISTVKSIIGAKSIVTESFFDFGKTSNINPDKSLKNNIMSRLDQKNDGNLKETIESNCHPIDRTVIKKFDPKEESPEGIAIRQIFKGFVILDYSLDEKYAYITTEDAYNMKIKPAIDKAIEEVKNSKTPTGTSTQKNPDYNNIGTTADGSAEAGAPASIVTTANADSTYGDGYGYNKKADAIKKKLNCTTYTYSPNSKMKIVRRTFD